jgi:hypothetical protein
MTFEEYTRHIDWSAPGGINPGVVCHEALLFRGRIRARPGRRDNGVVGPPPRAPLTPHAAHLEYIAVSLSAKSRQPSSTFSGGRRLVG